MLHVLSSVKYATHIELQYTAMHWLLAEEPQAETSILSIEDILQSEGYTKSLNKRVHLREQAQLSHQEIRKVVYITKTMFEDS